jgi:HEAT repeat protein
MLVAIPLVLKLPNLKPWFGVGDFFQVIRLQPWRSLLGSRRVYDESEEARIDLARTFGDSLNPLNLQPLAELLNDPSYEVKIEAIRSLARSRSGFAGDRLLEILEDPERRALWDHAAWGLGELSHVPAVDCLIERLGESNPVRARAMAARALGKIGDHRAVEPLLKALREEDRHLHVVSSCCWALLHLDIQAEAESALEGILLLRAREERYELLSIFCRWMHLSDRWLLVSDSRTSAWQSMADYIEGMPARWTRPRQAVIEAFSKRDHLAIRDLLEKRVASLPEADTAIPVSLVAVLKNAEDWSPLSVLATAFLLFGPHST